MSDDDSFDDNDNDNSSFDGSFDDNDNDNGSDLNKKYE